MCINCFVKLNHFSCAGKVCVMFWFTTMTCNIMIRDVDRDSSTTPFCTVRVQGCEGGVIDSWKPRPRVWAAHTARWVFSESGSDGADFSARVPWVYFSASSQRAIRALCCAASRVVPLWVVYYAGWRFLNFLVLCVCVCLVRVGCRWTAQWAVRGSEATADTTVHRGDLQLFSQITQWNFGTYTLLLLLFVCIILTWFIITTKLMKVSRRKQHWYASKLYLINRFTYTLCSLCRFAVFVVLCLDSTYAVSTLCLSSLKNDTSSKMHNGRIYISVCLGYISLTSLSFPKVFLRFVLKQPVGKVIVTNSSLEAYSHGQYRLLVVYLY